MQISDAKFQEFEAAMGKLRQVKMMLKVNWLDNLGLSEPQIHTLLSLANTTECTQSEMAKELCVSASAASQTAETLVRRGLVERSDDARDRRVSHLRLTEAGRQQVAIISDHRQQFYQEILAGLTATEIDEAIRTFTVLGRVMTEYQHNSHRNIA